MSERKKLYSIIRAHHLASHTSDQPCIYGTKTEGIGSTLKFPCVHAIGINTYRAAEEGVPAVEAEGGRADYGCDTNVHGVFGHCNGGGSRRLASSDARRLTAGCPGGGQ